MQQFKSRLSLFAENALLPLIAFLIPVWLPGSLLFTIFGLVFLILNKQIRHAFKGHQPLVFLNWVALFYLLIQIAGFWITQDFSNGLFNLQQKLSLLIFPIFFSLQKPISKSQIYKILSAFCLGTGLFISFLLFKAFYAWGLSQNTQVFYYMKFSHPQHPAYISAYVCMSIGIILYSFLQGDIHTSKPSFIGRILFCFFLFTMLYFIQSKAGILIAFAEICFVLFYILFRTWRKSRISFKIIAIAIFATISILAPAGLKKTRFSAMFKTLHSGSSEIDPKDSNQLRLKIWQTSLELLQKNWLTGTGAGDVKHELKSAYQEKGMFYAASLELNAHNQFLQTTLGGGIFQFILLLLYLIIPAVKTAPRLRLLAFMAMLIIAMNMLFESYFESQWGIVFSCFFLSLFTAPFES